MHRCPERRQLLRHPGEVQLVAGPLERNRRGTHAEPTDELRCPGLDDAFTRQREGAPDRGMSGHRQLLGGRKDANPHLCRRMLGRKNERRLGERHLLGDALHLVDGETGRLGKDRELVAFERRVGEDVEVEVSVVAHDGEYGEDHAASFVPISAWPVRRPVPPKPVVPRGWYPSLSMAKRKRPSGSLFDAAVDVDTPSGPTDEAVSLHEAAQTRYLNYALSVITSRALPDVRDGLKPVQRRILFTMWQKNLTADSKHRKCATVVGDVMGSYHPHGDAALYETLVRMAQPFSLRYPLVDGSGNFGSLDGDSAAAMRYTECRLTRISDELLTEIDQSTVPFRPNYDGTKTEPVVLPSRVPNLLINGATGIAVGMATNIPPHNLGEVCTALVKLLDNPDLSSVQLCRYVKGPDFPTGGQILNSPDELKEIYKTGSGRGAAARHLGGRVRRRARRRRSTSPACRTPSTSRVLVERIADVALSRKLPPLLDVQGRLDRRRADRARAEDGRRREDGDGVSLQEHAAPDQLHRQPDLPDSDGERRGRPPGAARSPRHSLALPALPARGRHQAARARARGARRSAFTFSKASRRSSTRSTRSCKIVRKSEGKQDAAQQIIKRFELDAEQTDAILELKIYRLARLEILIIRKEAEEKRKRGRVRSAAC